MRGDLPRSRLARRLIPGAARRVRRALDIVFIERPRGVPREAGRIVWLEDVGLAHDERRSYAPSPWGLLRRALPPSGVTSDDVFVDFGCGMGRVVLEAAEHYAFARVVGVELVPRFAEAAETLMRRNEHRLRATRWEIVNADVADYTVPDDVTVAYFHDPFTGPLFDSVVAQLRRSVERQPRRVRIVYLTPTELASTSGLAVVKRGATGFIQAGARYEYVVAELRGGS
jgi:SAM-dependent methyltransferase